jgi:hypothetical protein
MIELTREEALMILKRLSMFEGYLLPIQGSTPIAEQLDYPVELLTDKLMEAK